MADTKQEQIDKWVAKGYSPALAATIVADSEEIQPAPGAPPVPALALGTRIQVLTFETAVLSRTQSRTPEQTPNVPHWIYARVAEVVGDGGVLIVIVDHPGNVDHGAKRVVEPGEYRTAEDLEKELAELPSNPVNDGVKDLRRSLQVQIGILKPDTSLVNNRRRRN